MKFACGCCASITGRKPSPARYRWFTHEGRYFNHLCGPCAAEWLANAFDDDALMPHAVDLLEGAHT